MATISNYSAMILQSRAAELQILKETQDSIMALLSKEYKRVQTIIDGLEPGGLQKYTQLTKIQSQLDVIMDDLYGRTGIWQGRKIAIGGELEALIADGMDKGARAGVEGRTKASIALLNEANPDLTRYVPELFGGIREDVLQYMMTRPKADGKIFSQRFWNIKNESDKVLTRTVSSGLLEGKSARQISKDLRPYLKYQEGMTQKQVVSRSFTLARTEINNAFTECQIQCAKREPWNQGIKWNLSASHPKFDICDIYASQDLYGLGSGIYPPSQVPVRHPRCLCFLTDVLASIDEIVSLLRSDLGLDTPRERIVVQELTPDQKAEKARKAMLKDIERLEKKQLQHENEWTILNNKTAKAYQDNNGDEVVRLEKEIMKVIDSVDNVQKQIMNIGTKHLQIEKEKQAIRLKYTMTNTSDAFDNQKTKHLEELRKYIDPNIIPDVRVNIYEQSKRAHANLSYISLEKTDGISTTFHEYGHIIEFNNEPIKKEMQAFLANRTKDDVIEKLNNITKQNYDDDEITKKDKFINPYIGKIYKGGSTEILSMGLGYFIDNPIVLAKGDPGMFNLVYKALRGWIK
jgi:hypothetical protein